MSRLILVALISLALASCATVHQRYPEVDESRLQDVVAVVQLDGGRWLEQSPECNETREGFVTICLHAPFEMRAEVVQQLLGPRLPPTISFASTTHYGLPRSRPDQLALVHLQTDGKAIIMPHYQITLVGEDVWGNLSVPAEPEEIWWLPRGTNALAKRAQFQSPQDGFARRPGGYPEKSVAQHPDFYLASNWLVRPRLAIPVDKLETFLRKRLPVGAAFSCEAQ